MQKSWARQKQGFTIVELLIVIVVIAILAAITIVAFSGIQQRARDSQRKSDIATITKALEVYYLDNGKYPVSSGSTTVNASWSTSNDASWNNLKNALVPKYISSLPSDPTNSPNGFTNGKSYSYSYYGGNTGYCNAPGPNQMYIIVYLLEGASQDDMLKGNCAGTSPLGPYSGYSNYRVVKN